MPKELGESVLVRSHPLYNINEEIDVMKNQKKHCSFNKGV